jgi:hypothetical protein
MARNTLTRPVEVTAPSPYDRDNNCIPFELPASVQQLAELRISVMGISPLLTHSALSMLTPKKTRGNVIPTPEEEAEAGCYRNEDGVCCALGVMFQRTMLEAASAYRAKGKVTMQSVLAHVEVAEDYLPLVDPRSGQPLTTYEQYPSTVLVQKSRILRVRPRFNHWAIRRITFKYDAQLVAAPSIIVDVLADAGTRRGVGDFRPGKSKGSFGRFAVVASAFGAGPWAPYAPGAAVADEVERVEPADTEDEE